MFLNKITHKNWNRINRNLRNISIILVAIMLVSCVVSIKQNLNQIKRPINASSISKTWKIGADTLDKLISQLISSLRVQKYKQTIHLFVVLRMTKLQTRLYQIIKWASNSIVKCQRNQTIQSLICKIINLNQKIVLVKLAHWSHTNRFTRRSPRKINLLKINWRLVQI